MLRSLEVLAIKASKGAQSVPAAQDLAKDLGKIASTLGVAIRSSESISEENEQFKLWGLTGSLRTA